MSYPTDSGSFIMEPNSVGLGMFASVGFHAVLFVGLAFLPSTRETVKKPLRIVNLLPPPASSADTIVPQAKTSTLEDILNNPLPDLSAGYPPLGNTEGGIFGSSSDNSAFFGTNRDLNRRLDTSGLSTSDIPSRSFPSIPRTSTTPRVPTGSSNRTSSPPSSLTPAPGSTLPPPNIGSATATPPGLIGAVPEPQQTITNPPGSSVAVGPSIQGFPSLNNPGNETIPPSQQIFQPIISRVIPHAYPQSACQEKATGRVSIDYLRKADGSLFEGSIQFDVRSGSAALNDAALNLVTNYPESGTGALQRYLSPFEFVYSDEACAVANSDAEPRTDRPASNTGETAIPSQPEVKAPAVTGEEKKPVETPDAQPKNSSEPDKPDTQTSTPDSASPTEEQPSKPVPSSSPEKVTPENSSPGNVITEPSVAPEPSPAVPPAPAPSVPAAPPAPVEPVQPEPVELNTAPQPATSSGGTAADLAPIAPAQPVLPPEPKPIVPSEIDLPAVQDTPPAEE